MISPHDWSPIASYWSWRAGSQLDTLHTFALQDSPRQIARLYRAVGYFMGAIPQLSLSRWADFDIYRTASLCHVSPKERLQAIDDVLHRQPRVVGRLAADDSSRLRLVWLTTMQQMHLTWMSCADVSTSFGTPYAELYKHGGPRTRLENLDDWREMPLAN